MTSIDPETIKRLRLLATHLNMVASVFEHGEGKYHPQPNVPPEYDWIVGGFGICDLTKRTKEKQLTESNPSTTSLSA